jgi:hypothetical protein
MAGQHPAFAIDQAPAQRQLVKNLLPLPAAPPDFIGGNATLGSMYPRAEERLKFDRVVEEWSRSIHPASTPAELEAELLRAIWRCELCVYYTEKAMPRRILSIISFARLIGRSIHCQISRGFAARAKRSSEVAMVTECPAQRASEL